VTKVQHSKQHRSLLGIAVALATLASTTGCYKATFVEDPSALKRQTSHEEWADHFVFGLVGDKEYDVRQWCPNGTGMARTGGNVGTTTLSIVTLGIYTPRKVYITCQDKHLAQNDVASEAAVSE
jgi:hypothetical protein